METVLNSMDVEVQGLEVIYFGCKDYPGHYLHSNKGSSPRYERTPWGMGLDGGLLLGVADIPNGDTFVVKKNGWTAIAFWDRSGDARGGSNSAFLVHADISGDDLLVLARQQWPQLFSRLHTPLRLCGST